jgi:hypothetical protein
LEKSKDQAHATEQPLSEERPKIENRPSNERKKEPLHEPQKQLEPRREQPANNGANGRTSPSESKREEPVRNEKPRNWRVEQCVEFVADLLDALGLQRVILIGLSMGGAFAVGFTLTATAGHGETKTVQERGLNRLTCNSFG